MLMQHDEFIEMKPGEITFENLGSGARSDGSLRKRTENRAFTVDSIQIEHRKSKSRFSFRSVLQN